MKQYQISIVIEAEKGSEALAKIENALPDVVIRGFGEINVSQQQKSPASTQTQPNK